MMSTYIFRKLILAIQILSAVICYCSCKRFVEIPPSPTKITSAAVFLDSADATGAVLGMYTSILSNASSPPPLNGLITVWSGLSSDELMPSSSRTMVPDYLQFYQNALSAFSGNGGFFWDNAYPLIYQANACIEGLNGSATISSSVKNQLIGEAKIFRAFTYFNLVNLYGNVPLVVSTDYKVNSSLPRASVAKVYEQIIDDLKDAQNMMSISYITPGRVRANQYTASALLAKVYLYLQQWNDADTTASRIISSGVYAMEPDLNQVYLAGSTEAIWQWIPLAKGYETAEGFVFVPTKKTIVPNFSVSKYLLNAFEAGDQRRTNWIDSNIINGQTYYFPYKYKLGFDGNTSPLENYMIFRLGEQYLIRAEARAQENKLTDAIVDLNVVRNRAGLPSDSTLTAQADVLSAIYHERQIELFSEWGNRWYDLKRLGQVDAVMSTVTSNKGGSWTSNWQLYPISFSDITINPVLVQNPGYN